MNELREGWAVELSSGVSHYYAGIGGLGGRFRSICGRAQVDAEAPLTRLFPAVACIECTRKVAIAGPPPGPSNPFAA